MSTHLILDAQSVAAANGATFHLNPARKHHENPVLQPGAPHQWDSLQVSWPATVIYSPSDRKFRCWYLGLDVIQAPGRAWLPGYAESDDGVNWVKPELGQASFLDRPTNRIVTSWETSFLSFVFENPLPDAPPEQRFGGYWIETDHQIQGSWGKSLAWSPDGITWTRDRMAYHKAKRFEFQDVNQLLYNPDASDPAWRFIGYTQLFLPAAGPAQTQPVLSDAGLPHLRHIGLVHGEDCGAVDDAAEPVALAPEPGIDDELHFATVNKIGNAFVMLFESDRFAQSPIDGDLRLAVSSDGRTFRRVHPHEALVDTGNKGTWEENLLATTTAGMQMVGDEIYIFYIGCPRLYDAWPNQYAVSPERRGSQFAPCAMGLATLPRDRFAYAAGPGSITTHALELSDGELWLNTDGEVTVTAAGCHGTLTGETSHTVYRKVAWQGASPRGKVALTIELAPNAKLYSLRTS